MERYLNINGCSGIDAYEIGDDSILIKFKNQSVYLYTNDSTGSDNIKQMKILAQSGRGLNTFMNQNVNNYARKEQ